MSSRRGIHGQSHAVLANDAARATLCYAVSFFRPFALRRLTTLLLTDFFAARLRAKKPCFFFRLRLFGWYVLFIELSLNGLYYTTHDKLVNRQPTNHNLYTRCAQVVNTVSPFGKIVDIRKLFRLWYTEGSLFKYLFTHINKKI